jgi:hypothetical protein
MSPVFSTAVFRDLASRQLAPATRSRLDLMASFALTPAGSLATAFEDAHARMARTYRNEYVFKSSLVSKIVFGRHSPKTASALLELRMGASWADVLIVNGTSTTYEIKTDLDQFARLATQLPDYTARSEYVNVVTSEKRASSAERQLPKHIGVIAIRRTGAIMTVRPAESNMVRMSAGDLFSLLRTNEALKILGDTTGYVLDVPPGHAWKRARELFSRLDLSAAHERVIVELRRRGRGAAELCTSPGFPPSLRALAYATDLSAIGRARIANRLQSPAALLLEG